MRKKRRKEAVCRNSLCVGEARERLQPQKKTLCGSSSGSSRALALINSQQRCPATADRGPPPLTSCLRLITRSPPHSRGTRGKPIKHVLKLRAVTTGLGLWLRATMGRRRLLAAHLTSSKKPRVKGTYGSFSCIFKLIS